MFTYATTCASCEAVCCLTGGHRSLSPYNGASGVKLSNQKEANLETNTYVVKHALVDQCVRNNALQSRTHFV